MNNFLQNIIANKINSNVLKNWDSRLHCRHRIFEESTHEAFTQLLTELDSYTIFKKCFINSVFIEHMGNYLLNTDILFEECIFEVQDILHFLNFASNNRFNKCTFYVSSELTGIELLISNIDIYVKITSSNNTIVDKSYVTHLCELNNNDLSHKPDSLIGLSINNSDLSNVKLPDNKQLFMLLSDTYIYKTILPDLDFNKYQLDRIKFSHIVFGSKTICSEELIYNTGLVNCTLPEIDFNSVYKPNRSLSLLGCTLNKNTIFPKDKNFFNILTFTNCFLPFWDYSTYTLYSYTLSGCYLHKDSILPNNIFSDKLVGLIEHLQFIPSKYLQQYIQLCAIDNPYTFLSVYNEFLSKEALYLLVKKYNLVLS